MTLLTSPPVAFLLFIGCATALYLFGRLLAPKTQRNAMKSSLYAGGEIAAGSKAAPGYGRFFVIALFFAVLHLGALVLATVGLAGPALSVALGAYIWYAVLFYLGGLILALVILLAS